MFAADSPPISRYVGRAVVRFVAGVLPLLLTAGCSSGPTVEPAPTPVFVPPPAGVDSSVAAFADSIAAESFVALEHQERAADLQDEGRSMVQQSDSLWNALSVVRGSPGEVTSEDSVLALEAATDGGRTLVELDRLLRESELEGDELATRTAQLLDSAEATLEAAFRLNPFDARTTLWLSRVYELQARRLGRSEAYQQAIDELEKLTQLTPDQHSVYAMLANNHYYLGRWRRAADNYRRAEDVYLETYDLVAENGATLDSSLLFSYVRAQADMHVRLRDAGNAATAFRRALQHAPTAEDSTYVIGELEWMAWDDMNIASAVARDSLAALEQAGELEATRTGYRALLPMLRARTAIDEIDWRLAIVDYKLGHSADAAQRLQGLVARTAVDSLGVAVDSTVARYIDDYGTLCLNLGREFLHDQRDNRTALKYFMQATRVRWSGRAVAYLEVARLVQSNVEVALENANGALEGEANLTVEQRKDLYRVLMGLYRRTGDFDAARRYRDAYRRLEGERE